MEQRFYQVQPVEIILTLGTADKSKKFSTIDVTKFLEELHKEVAESKDMQPLSFTVLSGYEAHWNGSAGATDNVAILQASWLIDQQIIAPTKEIEFYCNRMAERFDQSIILTKVLAPIEVVGFLYPKK